MVKSRQIIKLANNSTLTCLNPLNHIKITPSFNSFANHKTKSAQSLLCTFQTKHFGRLSCGKRFVKIAQDTLIDLSDALDNLESGIFEDINYADGVLNIEMHDGRAYVLNKQAPNMQIWLSSPISGP